ncbi:MAG: hypothetical protein CVV21_02440 [Candidatus Goldiibacteriota bacterium HGW-Goldbacteria-1]|nr:MAG: hypothetical protein CVV21_02440 [Candidatus Goldiibacteriota bacterium HGW-Goldbacteria-1]
MELGAKNRFSFLPVINNNFPKTMLSFAYFANLYSNSKRKGMDNNEFFVLISRSGMRLLF